MCTALRKAGILMPDWNRIGKELNLNQQMPISAEIFFKSWHAHACDHRPSWIQLANALKETVIPKQASACVQENEGMNEYVLQDCYQW